MDASPTYRLPWVSMLMIRPFAGALAAVGVASIAVGFAQQTSENWTSYGRDYYEQRFSPLDQITDKNAAQLGLA